MTIEMNYKYFPNYSEIWKEIFLTTHYALIRQENVPEIYHAIRFTLNCICLRDIFFQKRQIQNPSIYKFKEVHRTLLWTWNEHFWSRVGHRSLFGF